LRFGKTIDSESRNDDMTGGEDVDCWRRMLKSTLKRQERAGRTRCFVVPVVQVGPAFLGVRDGARFIARQCQRRANDSELANYDQ